MQTDVPIYISTMRSDYRLAKALVASIEAHAAEPRIFLLPDDDFAGTSMFGHPIWRPTDPEVMELTGFYKKLRVFWGPADRFLYLDADQLVLRDLRPLLCHIAAKREPFFIANRNTRTFGDWINASLDAKARMFTNRAGDLRLLSGFDPGFDWRECYPLNSGEFASCRDAFDTRVFFDVFRRARQFDAVHGPGIDLRFSRRGLFMSDQGFLHYFLARHAPHLEVEWIDDLFRWGGRSEGLEPGFVPAGPWESTVVHWAGCPRPGPIPLRPGVPKAREWRRRYLQHCCKHRDWTGFLRDSWEYALHTSRDVASVWLGAVRRLGRSQAS
jgi:hypothetical protein